MVWQDWLKLPTGVSCENNSDGIKNNWLSEEVSPSQLIPYKAWSTVFAQLQDKKVIQAMLLTVKNNIYHTNKN